MVTHSLPRTFLIAALLALPAAACGGGGGGGGPVVPPGPDVTPPTISIDAPTGDRALIPGDTLSVTFTANDDRTADVEILLDRDGDLLTTLDQVSLFTGTDQNGTPVTVGLDTTTAPLGRATLAAIADDGTNAAVSTLGPQVLFHVGLAGVAAPRRNAYGVLQGRVAFGVGEAAQGGVNLNPDLDTGDAVVALIESSNGTQTNTMQTVDVTAVIGAPPTTLLPAATGHLVWSLLESDENAILNADGDATDVFVAHVQAAAQLEPTGGATLTSAGFTDRRIVLYNEPAAGVVGGLNGDGDATDDVVAILDLLTNTLTVFPDERKPGTPFAGGFGGSGLYLTDETVSGKILNGDGDALDVLPVLCDLQGGVALPAGANNVDPTAAFAAAPNNLSAVYYVDEFLSGTTNNDLDASDFIPAVNLGGVETFPGTGLNGGVGAPYAFADGMLVVYVAAEEGLVDRNGDGDLTDAQVLHWTNVNAPGTANTAAPAGYGLTGLALDGGYAAHVATGWLSLVVSETANGVDFTGDADTGDLVFMLMDLTVSPPVVHNTGLVPLDPTTLPIPGATLAITGVGGPFGVVVQAAETANGGDLNADGDATDTLCFFYLFAAPTTRVDLPDTGGFHAYVGGSRVAITAYENLTLTDLNGDGDTLDFVLRIFTPSGVVREAGLLCDQRSIPVTDDGTLWAYLRSETAEGKDLNGDGDQTDSVLGLWLP